MGFNLKEFNRAKFVHREENVRVPSLKQFFDENEEPIFTVRGLDGRELSKMREEGERQKAFAKLSAKFASGKLSDVADAATEALEDDIPDEVHRYMFAVEVGSVEPKLDRSTVIQLMRYNHGAFMMLANKIMTLSGEGLQVGELKGSSGKKASAQT